MNKKQFVINMTSNITAFAVNVIMSFFLTPYLIKILGKEAYSFYPLANNFVEYANIFAIAFNSVASRYVSIEIHRGNTEKANKYFNSILFSNIIIGLICALFSLVIIWNLENLINIPPEITTDVKILFAFVFMNFIINLSSVALGICTTVRNRLELTSLRKMESTFVKMVVTFGLLFIFSPRISYVGIGAFVATVFVLITNFIYTKKLLPEIKVSYKSFKFKYARKILTSGIWNSFNQLGELLFSGLNIMLANLLVSVSDAGNVSIARTVPSFMITLTATIVAVFVPTILKTYAVGTKKELAEILRSSSTITATIINLPLAIFLALGKEFYALWVPGEDINTIYYITIVLIVPIMVNSSISSLKNVFIALNKFKIPALTLCACGVCSVALSVISVKLFPVLGVFGIVITSSTIRILYNLLFSVNYVSRLLEIKAHKLYFTIFKSILYTAVVFISGVFFTKLVNINSWFMLFVSGAVLCIWGLGISLVLILKKSDRDMIFATIKNKLKKGKK